MWTVKAIADTETYPVRHPVLRKGRPLESCAFSGDDLPTTLHLGGFYDQRLSAVATFLKQDNSEMNWTNAYQLRGMAVLSDYQGKGLGMRILKSGEEALIERKAEILWMNARLVAVPFYEKLGYQKKGTAFDIPGIGPHFIMFKRLAQ